MSINFDNPTQRERLKMDLLEVLPEQIAPGVDSRDYVIEDLFNHIDELEKTASDFEDTTDDMRAALDDAEYREDELNDEIERLTAELSGAENIIEELQGKIKELQA